MVVIFDIESSCEDKRINSSYNMETIEIGAVKVKDKEIVDEFQMFIEPEYVDKLTDYCTNLTGLTYEDIEGSPKFTEAILSFHEFIEDSDIYSCGNFDKKFLIRELKEKGSTYEHELAANAIETNHNNLKTFYSQVTGNKKAGMLKMAGKLNVKLSGEVHRGLDDSINLAKIFIRLEEIREEELKKRFGKRISDIVKYIQVHHEEYSISIDVDSKIKVESKDGSFKLYSFLEFIDIWTPLMITDVSERNLKYLDNKDLSYLRRYSRLWYSMILNKWNIKFYDIKLV